MAHGGSISAEHGIGVLKRDELGERKSPVALALMAHQAGARSAQPHEPGPRGLRPDARGCWTVPFAAARSGSDDDLDALLAQGLRVLAAGLAADAAASASP